MNIRKSTRPDELHPRVLRELADAAAEQLSMILEKSWQSGEVPGDHKKGNIVPIFEKGRKKDPGNYQPVSPHLCAREGQPSKPNQSPA